MEPLLIHDIRLSQPDAPLALMLHGRGGNRQVMRAFARCLPEGCNLVFPQAPLNDKEAGGFSWWLPSSEDWRIVADKHAATLMEFLSALQSHYALRPRSVAALGFSQGAALLSLVLQQHPRRLSAAALLCGFVLESADSPPQREAVPICICHGKNDPVVPVERGREGAAYLRMKGYPVDYFEDDSPHKAGAANMRELTKWLRSKIVPANAS